MEQFPGYKFNFDMNILEENSFLIFLCEKNKEDIFFTFFHTKVDKS